MIQHILKIIWTERKINFWIFIELLLIFTILWFCTDYLTFMYRRYLKPVGFNIENTYRLSFLLDEKKMSEIMEQTGKERDEIIADCGWTIFDRIKRNPDIEQVAVSHMIYPYYGGNMSRKIEINGDTSKTGYVDYYGLVSPEYFDVFKIPIERGRAFTWDDYGAKRLIINMDDKSHLGEFPIDDIQWINGYFSDLNPERYDIVGVSGKSKRDYFHEYRTEAYQLFPRELMSNFVSAYEGTPIVFRAKAEVDTENFVDKFANDMYEQLSIDPLYLSAVTPFEDVKSSYMSWQSYDSNFKSIGAVVGFLLVNIFLGLIGTFWFRTRQRRNEIGLRMAIGSSQSGVKQIFIIETLLLVSMACIIGTVISVNIGMTDILKDIGVPIPNRSEKTDWIQYALNFGVTFLILAIVSTLAVWYPASQAAKIQPAAALRDE